MKTKLFLLVFSLSIMLIITSAQVFAYIDPGAGSAIMQGILTVVLIVSTTIGICWNKIKNLFSRKKNEQK